MVCRVERCRNTTLPRGGEEGDDKLPRVGEGDGDGRAVGDTKGCELLLEARDLGCQRGVGDGVGVRFRGDNDGRGGGIALDGGLEGECHVGRGGPDIGERRFRVAQR